MRWRIAGRGCGRAAAAVAASVATAGMIPPAAAAGAQQNVISTSPVVVSGTREETPSFDVPASIDAIDSDVIQDTHPTGAPALLQRLPGVVVQDRGSSAQDVQISSRGFGARATFGLRGVRVIVDGIPATMPDGQGSIGAFDLASAQRIEFLRGPFSALYGNLSGGVVQIFTADGPPRPTATFSLSGGSFGTFRSGLEFGGTNGALNYNVDVSRSETQGYREHSSARKDHLNAKFRYDLSDDSKLTFVVNALDQPDNLDPLGLTKEQLKENPRQAQQSAYEFNTRRSLSNRQAGLVYEKHLGANVLQITGYLGTRSNQQFLPIPLASQNSPTSSGGVSAFDRTFGGTEIRLTHHGQLAGRPLSVITGIDYERMADARKGYINDFGSQGALKRDEDDIADSTGEYVQARWDATERLSFSGGVRNTRVRFHSIDHFITTDNPDDSGAATQSAVTPVAGVLFHLTPLVNLYANVGQGFETPTFIEMAYRPNGQTGLNFDLNPSRSTSYEAGVKAFLGPDTQANLALFKVDTHDEVVVFSNSGGRATYQNAGATTRRGLEFSLDTRFGKGFGAYLSYAYLEAWYRDPFTTCVGFCSAPNTDVAPGNHLPGVPQNKFYGEVSWSDAASGFSTALEGYWQSKVYVDDANSEFADGYTLANWRAGFTQKHRAWTLSEFARIDTLFDRDYVAAVIVGDANGRCYAPGPGRSYLVGVSASYRF
jgi:iron complex outermembrane receptor protein